MLGNLVTFNRPDQQLQVAIRVRVVDPVEPLVAQIADAGGKLKTEQVKKGEDEFGVTSRIGGMFDYLYNLKYGNLYLHPSKLPLGAKWLHFQAAPASTLKVARSLYQ